MGLGVPNDGVSWYSGRMRNLSRFKILDRAESVAERAYLVARELPDSERYGMKSQLERAALSIALNIAEGLGRGSDGDSERSLRIASGSAAEVEIVVKLARRIHGLDADTSVLDREVRAIRHSLYRFIEVVRRRRSS